MDNFGPVHHNPELKGIISAVPIETINTAWPFGLDRAPIEGFLRSIIPERGQLIEDYGNGVRLYPPYTEGGPPRLVRADGRGGIRCSGDGCQYVIGGCIHCWEDRFRYGDLKGVKWVPPIKALRVTKKGGKPYEGVERYLPRPNPVVDGIKAATIMKHARLAMPVEFTSTLAEVARTLRRREEYRNRVSGVRRGRGCPEADIWDLATMAVTRIHDRLSYEELEARIERYAAYGDNDNPILVKPFDHVRVIEAMTGYTKSKDPIRRAVAEVRLTNALETMRDYLLPIFRDVTTVVSCDGWVVSTAATDNARSGHVSRTKSPQVTLHTMYEMRWGFMTAVRATWHQRGRGSAESPQYPYLIGTTKGMLPNTKVVLGDRAFGSARNRALSLRAGLTFFCEIKESQFEGKTALKFLSEEQIEAEKARCSPENPLYRQVYPFRNRVEGWHEVQRSQSERNLMSRVDISRRPLTKDEKSKENPLRADLDLPEDDYERELIITTEQFVGRAVHNEVLCRQIMSLIRAIVKAQEWYGVRIDFAYPRPFQPRPEDDEMSIFRPRLEDGK